MSPPGRNRAVYNNLQKNGALTAPLVLIVQLLSVLEFNLICKTVRSTPTPEDINGCAVVYLPDTNVQLQQQLIDSARHRPVLTISNGADFVGRGGMIALEIISEDRKFKQITRLGFSINLKTAEQAGIVLSSKLLDLATKVRR